ncbi:GntR family transcriptional regulator [Marinomonas mediterranea]|uniref:Transcriptional regulator, GntR family n=1 Tax=Marinomonas mediterranea (strain ATCC 700492 / JCM 21426 / NBRC 103028 / MMB-1) TaxID=717774 RepID=F2K1Q1_MARM1|nr:GntR family transcriptional regulator [Marinomonas mediterranea]ADZ93385.1 transcriptional regulator, GntR family [Marinomonas mediterranea MMB-1]WCN19379.1 GntR family transcriptional regulator [Marinomonas mediterranea MMB-1]
MADFLYKGVVDWFLKQVAEGELAAGHKMPSLRSLSKQLKLSLNTVIHGYDILTEEGWVESRPKSGYFVCHRSTSKNAHVLAGDRVKRLTDENAKLIWSALSHRAALVDQSDAFLLPGPRTAEAELPVPGKGHLAVREAVADHLKRLGIKTRSGNVWLARSAVSIFNQVVQSLTKTGDQILVITPCDPRLLGGLQSLHRDVLCLQAGDRGVDLDEAIRCIRDNDIRLIVFPSQFAFPAGQEISNLSLRRWLTIINEINIPAVEWDLASHLGYKASPLMSYKSLDTEDRVIYIGGVESKGSDRNAAWCIPSRYTILEGAFLSADFALNDSQQQALSDALLGTQKHSLSKRSRQIWSLSEKAKAILESKLGDSIRFAYSKGGMALWMQMEKKPSESDMAIVAAKHRHAIVPGNLMAFEADASDWLAINVTYPQMEELAVMLAAFIKANDQSLLADPEPVSEEAELDIAVEQEQLATESDSDADEASILSEDGISEGDISESRVAEDGSSETDAFEADALESDVFETDTLETSSIEDDTAGVERAEDDIAEGQSVENESCVEDALEPQDADEALLEETIEESLEASLEAPEVALEEASLTSEESEASSEQVADHGSEQSSETDSLDVSEEDTERAEQADEEGMTDTEKSRDAAKEPLYNPMLDLINHDFG